MFRDDDDDEFVMSPGRLGSLATDEEDNSGVVPPPPCSGDMGSKTAVEDVEGVTDGGGNATGEGHESGSFEARWRGVE